MKKSLIALSVISLLGMGAFTTNVSASDEGVIPTQNNFEDKQYKNRQCDNLGEEQKALLEKGYSELSEDEKKLFDDYKGMRKRDLTEEQRNEFFELADKVHKYMDDEFKAQVAERREAQKERILNKGNCDGSGKGNGRGKGSCK